MIGAWMYSADIPIIICLPMLDYRDMGVLWVRTQIFLIILLTVQRWVHRHMDVFYVRTQVFLIMILIEKYTNCYWLRSFCPCMQKTSTPLLRICIYAQTIQRWKTLLSKITVSNFCAHTQKNFHVSIKDLRMCANNPALEDFLIQNHSHVRKKTCQVSIKVMLCVYMRK